MSKFNKNKLSKQEKNIRRKINARYEINAEQSDTSYVDKKISIGMNEYINDIKRYEPGFIKYATAKSDMLVRDKTECILLKLLNETKEHLNDIRLKMELKIKSNGNICRTERREIFSLKLFHEIIHDSIIIEIDKRYAEPWVCPDHRDYYKLKFLKPKGTSAVPKLMDEDSPHNSRNK